MHKLSIAILLVLASQNAVSAPAFCEKFLAKMRGTFGFVPKDAFYRESAITKSDLELIEKRRETGREQLKFIALDSGGRTIASATTETNKGGASFGLGYDGLGSLLYEVYKNGRERDMVQLRLVATYPNSKDEHVLVREAPLPRFFGENRLNSIALKRVLRLKGTLENLGLQHVTVDAALLMEKASSLTRINLVLPGHLRNGLNYFVEVFQDRESLDRTFELLEEMQFTPPGS